jgi:hypothetical protein
LFAEMLTPENVVKLAWHVKRLALLQGTWLITPHKLFIAEIRALKQILLLSSVEIQYTHKKLRPQPNFCRFLTEWPEKTGQILKTFLHFR